MEEKMNKVPLPSSLFYMQHAPMLIENDQEIIESSRKPIDSLNRYSILLITFKGHAFIPSKNLRFPHFWAIVPRNTLWFDICG